MPEATDGSDEVLDTGDRLPDVEAIYCDGDTFRLRSLEDVVDGGLLLSFHGFAFSAVASNWWRRYERYGWSDMDVAVAGVCRDGPYAVGSFLREIDVSIGVFADVDGRVAREFGVLDDVLDGATTAPRHSVYVFDSDGVARYRWISPDGLSPEPVDEIETAVDSL